MVKAALVELDDASFEAELILPPEPKGVVLIAHGSGSSRLSPRNRFVARLLRERGLGTLLVDTETPDEQRMTAATGKPTIDVLEMANRILLASDWLEGDAHAAGLPVGYLGAGTGAAAAFRAAAERPNLVRAIVSRGARVELATEALSRVRAPTLLIVGARDVPVVHLNREAMDGLAASVKRLEVVPGARHMFEEPGTLAAVAMHAANWFIKHLRGTDSADLSRNRGWPAVAVVQDSL
ncbi:MAG: dienelactone hydrolase family protein [Fimbriimonadales bacterium]